MSIRRRTGSIRTPRSTTNESRRSFRNSASRPASTGWRLRVDQGMFVMHARVLAIAVLVPLNLVGLAAQATGIREVSASDRSLITLNTKLRYTTMIVLPDGEDILDIVCGDRD